MTIRTLMTGHVASLLTVDVAAGRMQRLVTGDDYVGVSFPHWTPDGKQIAFLGYAKGATDTRPQVFVVGSQGGTPKQITTMPTGVQQIASSPDSRTIGLASADEPEKKSGYQRWNDSFDVQPNFHLFMTAPVPPTHVWMVPTAVAFGSRPPPAGIRNGPTMDATLSTGRSTTRSCPSSSRPLTGRCAPRRRWSCSRCRELVQGTGISAWTAARSAF